jgi:hypothetical protein
LKDVRRPFILLLLALSAVPLRAATKPRLDVDAGVHRDRFSWNIAGDMGGAGPNVLSELSWDDLRIYRIGADGRAPLGRALVVHGAAAYGWIVDGTNRDSDYLGDNRTVEFSRSENGAGGGKTLAASLALGTDLAAGPGIRFTPLAGYAYRAQTLAVKRGSQTIPRTGRFDGLNSSYRAAWHGPWLGAELSASLPKGAGVAAEFQHHWAAFDASADWNLRADLAHPKSFAHQARGNGLVEAVSLRVPLLGAAMIQAKYAVETWTARNGVDRTFFADGSVGATRLNEVRWTSRSVSLGLALAFR